MLPGDLDAARRLAVVWLEPPNGFFNPSQSITEALFKVIPHLQFELVPSGIGATYVRFRSHATREMAMVLPDLMHEGVRIRLEREEEAQRVPSSANTCVLLWASPLAAEHFTPEGINAFFSSFGEVLEIDPICLLGRDMSAVKGIVLVNRASDVPNDAWPWKGPWGARVVHVEVIKVWPHARSFVDGVYCHYFGPPPPFPFRHSRRMALSGRPSGRESAAGLQLPAADGGRRNVPGHGRRTLALILEAATPKAIATRAPRLCLDSASSRYVVPPPSPLSSVCCSDSSSSSPSGWCGSSSSGISSAGGVSLIRGNLGLSITEITDEAPVVPQVPVLPAPLVQPVPVVRKSSRLAGKESEEYLDMVTKAVKFRELKDSLKFCSARLQAHVSKNKVLSKLSPMTVKSVAALKAAAFGRNAPVPPPVDD
jgi:hypothetical protein